ncbi:MAG: glycosyltransferase family 87 protein [Candidatus Limnocylindrales bacterium]
MRGEEDGSAARGTPSPADGSRLARGVGAAPPGAFVRADAAAWALALVGAATLVAALVAFQGSRGAGYDFSAYFDAARRLAAGQPLYQGITQHGPFAPGPAGLYLYPPPLAVLLLALVPLGSTAAAWAWQALHVVALVGSCAILPASRRVRLASFGVAALSLPTLLDLNLGNVSLLVLLAGAVAWRASTGSATAGDPRGRATPMLGAGRRAWAMAAGILLALAIAVRPEVGILLLWWAWRREWAPLGATLVVGLVLAAGSALVAGIGAWQGYLRLLVDLRGAGTASSDVGLTTLAARLGLADPLATLLFFAGALLALAAVVAVGRRDPEAGLVSVVTGTLLVVPLLWPHYLVLLLLPGALLAGRGRPWGLALPWLAWLPGPVLPLLALAGCWAPLLVAGAGTRGCAREPEPAGPG